MPEDAAQDNHGNRRENQIDRCGSQPCLELLPLLPKKVSDQNITNGGGRRACKVKKEINPPWYLCHAGQYIDRGRRKNRNKARDEHRLGSMTVEILLRPMEPCGR